MQGAARRQGPSLAKRRNTADALSRGNPKGRADSCACLCRKPLAVNDTATRLASRPASRIGLVAGVKLVLTRPRFLGLLLQSPHMGIHALTGEQIGVAATLDNAPRLHYQNLVGLNHGG